MKTLEEHLEDRLNDMEVVARRDAGIVAEELADAVRYYYTEIKKPEPVEMTPEDLCRLERKCCRDAHYLPEGFDLQTDPHMD